MAIARLPEDEDKRLQSLRDLRILDTPIEKSFDKITRIVQNLFDVPIVNVTIIDKDRQWFKASQGMADIETSRDVSFCAHAILEDEITIVPNALEDDRFSDNPMVLGDPNIRFYVGCPVREKTNHKVGTLCMVDTKPRTLTPAQIACFRDLASLVENELQNYSLMGENQSLNEELEKIRKASSIDKLTRLWNRGSIEEILKHVYASSQKNNSLFLVAIADVDHFKLINDTYGHPGGDKVLAQVAKTLVDSSRKMDAIGRWGGEEFLIVIYGQEPKIMYQVLTRMKEKVENTPIECKHGAVSCSITIGATIFDPKHPKSIEELIADADKNLYKGKNAGRNRVVF